MHTLKYRAVNVALKVSIYIFWMSHKVEELMGRGGKNYWLCFYREVIHGIIILYAFFIIFIVFFMDSEIFS